MKYSNQLLAQGFFIFATLFLVSCKKNSEPIHYSIPDALKEYYVFQPGSYWIYQNIQTSLTDCTYISRPPQFYHEATYINDGKTIYSITDKCGILFEGHIFHSCSIDYNDVQFDGFMAYNQNVPVTESIHYYNNYFFENLFFYDSLAVDNHYFSNVTITKDSHLPYHEDTTNTTMKILSAKNIGIIQTTITKSTSDSTWNLIRFHIIQ